MKGIATWILVIGSALLGIAIFAASATILAGNIEMAERQMVVEQVNTLFQKVKRTCVTGGIGEIYYYKIKLPDGVRAVYAANKSDAQPPDKVSVYISENRSVLGNYFCVQFFAENIPRCQLLDCYLNFTYIGTPSMKNDLMSLLARISSGSPVYGYRVRVEKLDMYYIRVDAGPLIS